MRITFTAPTANDEARPAPAARFIPDWFRKAKPDLPKEGVGNFPANTIKRCMPVLDAYSAGYIIPLPAALHLSWDGSEGGWEWSTRSSWVRIEEHGRGQLPDHPFGTSPFLKLINMWGMKTSRGTSVLITAPLNRFEIPIVPLAGVVDTDKYHNRINFPFVFREPGEWTLDAGTPLVQVIPFKRQRWSMKAAIKADPVAEDQSEKVAAHLNGYKRLYRTPKTYVEEQG